MTPVILATKKFWFHWLTDWLTDWSWHMACHKVKISKSPVLRNSLATVNHEGRRLVLALCTILQCTLLMTISYPNVNWNCNRNRNMQRKSHCPAFLINPQSRSFGRYHRRHQSLSLSLSFRAGGDGATPLSSPFPLPGGRRMGGGVGSQRTNKRS